MGVSRIATFGLSNGLLGNNMPRIPQQPKADTRNDGRNGNLGKSQAPQLLAGGLTSGTGAVCPLSMAQAWAQNQLPKNAAVASLPKLLEAAGLKGPPKNESLWDKYFVGNEHNKVLGPLHLAAQSVNEPGLYKRENQGFHYDPDSRSVMFADSLDGARAFLQFMNEFTRLATNSGGEYSASAKKFIAEGLPLLTSQFGPNLKAGLAKIERENQASANSGPVRFLQMMGGVETLLNAASPLGMRKRPTSSKIERYTPNIDPSRAAPNRTPTLPPSARRAKSTSPGKLTGSPPSKPPTSPTLRPTPKARTAANPLPEPNALPVYRNQEAWVTKVEGGDAKARALKGLVNEFNRSGSLNTFDNRQWTRLTNDKDRTVGWAHRDGDVYRFHLDAGGKPSGMGIAITRNAGKDGMLKLPEGGDRTTTSTPLPTPKPKPLPKAAKLPNPELPSVTFDEAQPKPTPKTTKLPKAQSPSVTFDEATPKPRTATQVKAARIKLLRDALGIKDEGRMSERTMSELVKTIDQTATRANMSPDQGLATWSKMPERARAYSLADALMAAREALNGLSPAQREGFVKAIHQKLDTLPPGERMGFVKSLMDYPSWQRFVQTLRGGGADAAPEGALAGGGGPIRPNAGSATATATATNTELAPSATATAAPSQTRVIDPQKTPEIDLQKNPQIVANLPRPNRASAVGPSGLPVDVERVLNKELGGPKGWKASEDGVGGYQIKSARGSDLGRLNGRPSRSNPGTKTWWWTPKGQAERPIAQTPDQAAANPGPTPLLGASGQPIVNAGTINGQVRAGRDGINGNGRAFVEIELPGYVPPDGSVPGKLKVNILDSGSPSRVPGSDKQLIAKIKVAATEIARSTYSKLLESGAVKADGFQIGGGFKDVDPTELPAAKQAYQVRYANELYPDALRAAWTEKLGSLKAAYKTTDVNKFNWNLSNPAGLLALLAGGTTLWNQIQTFQQTKPFNEVTPQNKFAATMTAGEAYFKSPEFAVWLKQLQAQTPAIANKYFPIANGGKPERALWEDAPKRFANSAQTIPQELDKNIITFTAENARNGKSPDTALAFPDFRQTAAYSKYVAQVAAGPQGKVLVKDGQLTDAFYASASRVSDLVGAIEIDGLYRAVSSARQTVLKNIDIGLEGQKTVTDLESHRRLPNFGANLDGANLVTNWRNTLLSINNDAFSRTLTEQKRTTDPVVASVQARGRDAQNKFAVLLPDESARLPQDKDIQVSDKAAKANFAGLQSSDPARRAKAQAELPKIYQRLAEQYSTRANVYRAAITRRNQLGINTTQGLDNSLQAATAKADEYRAKQIDAQANTNSLSSNQRNAATQQQQTARTQQISQTTSILNAKVAEVGRVSSQIETRTAARQNAIEKTGTQFFTGVLGKDDGAYGYMVKSEGSGSKEREYLMLDQASLQALRAKKPYEGAFPAARIRSIMSPSGQALKVYVLPVGTLTGAQLQALNNKKSSLEKEIDTLRSQLEKTKTQQP